MKSPRDVSGPELVKAMWVLGYECIRQDGFHIRLTTQLNGEFHAHVTVPGHPELDKSPHFLSLF